MKPFRIRIKFKGERESYLYSWKTPWCSSSKEEAIQYAIYYKSSLTPKSLEELEYIRVVSVFPIVIQEI